MSNERLADFRRVFAEIVFARGGCRDRRILEAFATVPRHEFLGPGPWHVSEHGDVTPSDDPALTYQDIGLALAPDRGIPTGLPSLHARCIEACAPKSGDRVVHVGAGSGYFTAILAHLIGEQGSVLAFEIDRPLAERAKVLLGSHSNVRVDVASGVRQLETSDLIYVCAGLQQLPLAWLDALSQHGRLMFPLAPGTEEGAMLLVTRDGDAFRARFVSSARFVPCIGALDPAKNEALAKAFRSGTRDEVRSLKRTAPDDTAWFTGDGWWLSTSI